MVRRVACLLPGRALTVLAVRTGSEPTPYGEAEISSGALSSMGHSSEGSTR
jgi:hypothetical protein